MFSEDARELIEEFSQGYEIRVNVPPENPEEAFKRTKRTDNPLIDIGSGVVLSY